MTDQKLILIIDDEPDLLLAVRIRLEAEGYRCETATDGRKGLELVARELPDLLIVDLIMPVMDGYEMCRHLKANKKTASIPVVVLTAVPDRSLAGKINELDVSRVMHKPFDSSELVSAVKELFTQS